MAWGEKNACLKGTVGGGEGPFTRNETEEVISGTKESVSPSSPLGLNRPRTWCQTYFHVGEGRVLSCVSFAHCALFTY